MIDPLHAAGTAIRAVRHAMPGNATLATTGNAAEAAATAAPTVSFAEAVNAPAAVRHAHRKGNLAPVLERAGIPHAADGTLVRTRGELERAVADLGGEARITGGRSHSMVSTDSGVVVGASGVPEPTIVRTSQELDSFAKTQLDHGRTYLVQPVPAGQELHVMTAGDSVLDGIGSGAALAPTEQEMATAAARAFGLDAGRIDLVRDLLGGVRVVDVHATPPRMTSVELDALATSPEFSKAIATARPATTEIADAVESAKVQVGILNMGRVPGKNISRTLAEVERQGGSPVFLPTGATRVADDGTVLVHDVPTPVDVVLNRTGSIISDEALGTLGDIERAGIPVMNGADAVSLVRDKNMQARTLVSNGVAHPVTAVVDGTKDVGRALQLIGPSMVLKNPASSEGRGVMFLDGEDVVRGVTNLFERRAADSKLVATRVDGTGDAVELADRASTEHVIRHLGRSAAEVDAQTGVAMLRMQTPVRLTDQATGASVVLDESVSVLTVSDAFRDARPGASLKAETWYREAAGADTRVHVARLDGEHQVLEAMQRRVAPNEFGDARSNLSLGGGASSIQLTDEQRATALAGARAFDLDVAGVDLIDTAKGPVVLEVNASPGLDIEKTTGAVADRWIAEAMRRGAPHRASR